MRGTELLKGISYIDPDLLAEAEASLDARPRRTLAKWAAAAACLCIVAAAAFAIVPRMKGIPDSAQGQAAETPRWEVTLSENGVTIPPLDVSLDRGDGPASMIGFFIHDGHCYVDYEWLDGSVDIVGKHLGTITGLINGWTPADGYVEHAGSVTGEIYEAQGYDPSFLLCMKHDTGQISTYVCSSGVTMKYGKELYEDRLQLSDYDVMEYETRDSWFYGNYEICRAEQGGDVIRSFIAALDAAELLPWDTVLEREDRTPNEMIFESEIYHVYFRMSDGLPVHLRLYEHGYVRFDGMMEVGVQLSDADFAPFLALLEDSSSAAPVTGRDPNRRSLDRCLVDPELSPYLPTYVPEGLPAVMGYARYNIDRETGKETGTRAITVEYRGADAFPNYAVTVSRSSEYGKLGWAGPRIKYEALNEETLAEYGKTESATGRVHPYGWEIDVGVEYGNILVVLHAYGIEPEEALAIFRSVNTD